MHGFCRPAKQTGGFHERELAAWARLDKFGDVEPSLRFVEVADDQPTMTLDDARERPYLFMRLRARGPSPRALATVDGAYYVCLAWHGEPMRAVDAGVTAADPLSTPVRKPTLRRASASSHLTPFSWASVVAGRPTSPSPPASPTLPLAGLPETPEVHLKAMSEAVGCAALVESTSALDISADDFPAPPISPRLSRPQRRRAASSSSFVPPTRSVSRSADLPRYTGAFADATLSGLYVSSDGTEVRAVLYKSALTSADSEPRPQLRRKRSRSRHDPSPHVCLQLGYVHDSLTHHSACM